MKNLYSIIIPIYNEENKIPDLLLNLKDYNLKGHQIIIVDDGSIDDSYNLLSKSSFIRLLRLRKNKGKGVAIKKGLTLSENQMVIVYDGDLELHPNEIKKLMILDKKNNIDHVFASRYKKINLFDSYWDFGNYLFTKLFNYINKSNLPDALCCAKSFHKSDINIKSLISKTFDIDVEIASQLINKSRNFDIVHLDYNRRQKQDGKKLKMIDSLSILKRILKSI